MSDYLGAVPGPSDTSGLTVSTTDSKALVSRTDDHLSDFDVLLDSRVQSKQLRNRYEAFVNKLPVEILAHIFHISANRTRPILLCDKDPPGTYQRITVLASVCWQWRHITLGLDTLWSLISFSGEGCHRVDNPLARLWLERSAKSPLHLIISHQYTEPIVMTPMLIPYANRFRTLSIVADSLKNICTIMTVWLDHGAPGSVTELSISASRNELYLSVMLDLYGKLSSELIDKFLRPLRVLQLRNVCLDWDSAAYEGLFSFRLEGRAPVTITQLARILNASPCLNSLFLKHILLRKDTELLPSPISLPNLHTLYIDDIAPGSIDRIFQLIQPGLHYDVHLNISPEFLPLNGGGDSMNISRLGPIFSRPQRFNLVSLSLGKYCEPDSFRTFLQSLPRLRVLYLHDSGARYSTATLNALTRTLEQEPVGTNESSSASLQAIHIMGTILDSNAFKAMISSYSLQQLSLARWAGDSNDGDGDTNVSGPTEELCTWASSHVPDFVCYNVGEMALCTLRLHPFIWRLW